MMYKTIKAPLAVQVEITDNCNQLCTHCYRACQSMKKREITRLKPKNIVKLVEELAHCEVFQVCFTGGEPLMYPATLKAGILKARNLGMHCYMNSNLQLLNDDLIHFLKDHEVNVLTSLLSFDASVHEKIAQRKGIFQRLLANIYNLTEAGAMVSANMVVRKENADQVYETGKLAYNLGVRRFSATKVAPSPGTDYKQYQVDASQLKKSLDDLLLLKEEFGIDVDILESYPLCFIKDLGKYSYFARRNCTAGVLNCSISPNGNVRPCSHADMSYGNIFKQGLQIPWLAMQEWRDGSLINDECKKCPYLLRCSGGCRMDAKLLFGDIKERDPLMTSPKGININNERFVESVEIPDLLLFYESSRMRKEEFGGIIVLNYETVLLSHAGFDVLNRIKKGGVFNWKKLDVFGLSFKDKHKFFLTLYQKKFFKVG